MEQTEISQDLDTSERLDESLDREEVVEELAPSAKLVLKVIEYEGSMTQREISDESRLSTRTTRKAVKELIEAGLVESVPCLKDGRKKIYRLKGKSKN